MLELPTGKSPAVRDEQQQQRHGPSWRSRWRARPSLRRSGPARCSTWTPVACSVARRSVANTITNREGSGGRSAGVVPNPTDMSSTPTQHGWVVLCGWASRPVERKTLAQTARNAASARSTHRSAPESQSACSFTCCCDWHGSMLASNHLHHLLPVWMSSSAVSLVLESENKLRSVRAPRALESVAAACSLQAAGRQLSEAKQ